jgi:hypothetical protein
VIAALHARHLLLEGAEVPGERGPPELVVEGGSADWSLEHDRESADNPVWPPRASVSHGLLGARNAQVRTE